MLKKTNMLAVVLVLILTTACFAPTWISTSNNRWDVAGNWSGGIPSGTPTTDSEALLNTAGTVPCLVDSATTATPGRISVYSNNNVLNITGGSCIAQYNTGRLTVGWAGVATLNVSGGTVTGNYALHMGRATGGNGTINVSGTGRVIIYPNPSTGGHEVARVATEFSGTTAIINVNGGTFKSEIDLEAGIAGVTQATINVNSGVFDVAVGTTTGNTHSHSMTIGRGGGPADVNMTGGTISVSNNLTVGSGTGSTGTIIMTGGALNVTTNIILGATSGTGFIYFDGGTISASNVSAIGDGSKIEFGSTSAIMTLAGDDRTVVNGYITAGKFTQTVSPYASFVTDYSSGTDTTTVYVYNPDVPEATNPIPVSGATSVSINTDLGWKPGIYAVSHDVYLGSTYDGVNNATHASAEFKGNQEPNSYDPGTLNVDSTYYWRIDEVNPSNPESPWKGLVWNFATGNPLKASNPNPANMATGVTPDADLSWTAGQGATSHDVYLGTDSSAVFNATHSSSEFKGNQASTTYDPGTMINSTTYYWRIDEIVGGNTYKGDVWSFTVEAPPALKKGPYLIYPGDNTQMTVLWQLAGTSVCTIDWGLNTNYSTGTYNTSEYGIDHQHKYTINNLSPGTKYYYRVRVGASYYTGTFYAAPPSNATSVKLFAYGDTRSQPAVHNTVNGAMINTYTADPAFQTITLHSGDWPSADTEDAWANEFFPPEQTSCVEFRKNVPIQGCWGNHEGAGVCFEKYYPYPYVTPEYWSFDYGPAHISIIDQSLSYATGSAQYNWLQNDLATSNKTWKFIVLHQPGYSALGGHGDDTNVQNYIQPLCVQYSVQIVFAGHNHYYARKTVDGIKHITTGGGGAPLYTPQPKKVEVCSSSYHFCKVEIAGGQLNFTAVKPDGTVLDSFVLTAQGPDTTPPTPNPATWATAPYAVSSSQISMTATTGSDPSGPVEYYFDETSGNPGGTDSGWQTSTSYSDTGLSPNTQYTYTVTMRDALQNTGTASSPASATTQGSCTPSTMHVDSIVCSTVAGSPPYVLGRATVTIKDNCGNPVSGALVDGTFTGSYNESFYNVVTNENGIAVFTTTTQVKKPSFTFCVNDVTGSLTYNPAENVVTCSSY